MSDSSAKYTIPSSINPTLNENVYFQIREIDGTYAVIKSDFRPNKRINFFSDEKVRYGWITPRKGVHLEQLPSNTSATASFSSGSCTACYHDGNSHSINVNPMLFVIGDEHIPAALGVGGTCAAVIRVDNGDFHQAKAVLLHHLRCGLRINKGSIMVTFLLSHLFRSGYSAYWEDFQNFSTWANNLLKISVLPGIPPYQSEQADSDLISIGQLYSHLQGAYLGVGAAPNNQIFMMWKPFLETMDKHGAGTVEVPVPPIHIKEIGMYFKCSTNIQAGIDVSGNCLPAEVFLDFFSSVINIIKSSNIARHLYLPNFESLQHSLHNNFQHGKKIFCYGTSILRNIVQTLKPMCHSKGIELHSDCLGGDFLQRFKTIDLEELKCANKKDILILSWLGNRLINTESCKPIKTGDLTTYHTIGAVIPTDLEVDYTVVETGRTIRKLAAIFPGRTYFVGPFPRHITPCCSSTDQSITGPNNASVDMVKYCHAYSTYICGAPGVITNNVTFIHSNQIFGDNLDANFLMGGVHLSKDANHKVADFIINLLSDNLNPTTPLMHNRDFSEHLIFHGVVEHDASSDSQQLAANLRSQHLSASFMDLDTE